MNDALQSRHHRILHSVAIATLASGLFWTGFPVYMLKLADVNSDFRFSLSEIYAFAVAGSFIFSAISGRWADIGRHREFSIASQLASAGLIGVIAALSCSGSYVAVLFVLPFMYFNFAFGGVMESVWLFEKSEHAELKDKVIFRGVILTGMKIIGFALGPLCFGALGFAALAICAVLFAAASVVQLQFLKLQQPMEKIDVHGLERVSFFKTACESKALWAGLLTGALSVPLNPIFAGRALQLGGDGAASCFWLCAGLASIAGMLCIKRFKITGSFRQLLIASVVMMFAVASALLAKNSDFVIASASLYVFCIPLFSVQLQLRILQNTRDVADENLGSRVAFLAFITDGGIFLGMTAAAASERLGAPAQLVAVVVLLALRLQRFAKSDD
ncbi:hypothetical protein BH10BDE1_BH10BDE1_16540 [soil metagenome]